MTNQIYLSGCQCCLKFRPSPASRIPPADDASCMKECVCLLGRVALRALSSLQETHEAVLQYLEAAGEGEVDAGDPIILAAARSLGR